MLDDTEQNREMLSRRLKARGYTVLTAEDGYGALDLIRTTALDLIVLDNGCPPCECGAAAPAAAPARRPSAQD